MALISKASLLMVPSTYEEGTLYNVLPSGNRAPDSTDQNSGYDQTRADFTFDRGSNAAATRIGSDGLIKKYRENLLLQSNNFGTTWVTNSASVTSGQSDKDGGTSAWKLQKSGANGRIYQSVTSNGVHTFSVYAKAGDDNWAYLVIGSSAVAWFDLANGAIGTKSSEIDAKIESYGDYGFYRISLTFNHNNPQVRIYPADGNNDTSGSSGSIFIQSAQLETGLVATDYLDSGATTAKAGVLVDLPRINYDANGENGSLLLEPQRANLVQFSEYFGGWSVNSNITKTSNYIVSPDGTQNATRLQFTANGFCANTPQSLATYTISCYAKRNDSGTQNVGFFTNGSGVVNSAWAVTSEWKRFSYTFPTLNGSFIGIAGVSGADISVYGFQIEGLATYATSYIPNHGTSSGVTRAADDSVATGLGSIAGQSEGTLFAYFKTIGDSGTPYISLNQNNGVSNRVLIYNNSGISVEVRVGGTKQAEFTTSTQGLIKAAIAYKANDFAFYINGSLIGADSSGSTFGAGVLEQLNLGFGAQDGAEIHQLALFKERLTNAELATLTTL